MICILFKTTAAVGGHEQVLRSHSLDAGAGWVNLALQTCLNGWSAHALGGPNDQKRGRSSALGSVRKLSLWICSWNDGVIPIAMELIAHDVQVRHFGIGDLHADGICRFIERTTDGQPFR